MTATTTTITTTSTTTSIPRHHGGQHKKCNPATCCSPSKIWRAIQTAISTDDKEGLTLMFENQERVPHIKNVLIKERNINDASALPPSHKHRVLQFDKTVRLDATKKFGKSVTDLNGLQVALFYEREDIACQLLHFLRQHASLAELNSFLGHVWGKGNSSLHLACFHGMPRLVQLLLEMGADPHVTNAYHFKPADCCKDPGCLAVLEKATAVLTKGADNEQDDDFNSSADLVSSAPASSLSGGAAAARRRPSGGLLGLPTSKSISAGLKRQGPLPDVNSSRSFVSSGGSAEKRIKSRVSSVRPTTPSPLASVQIQSIKKTPKVPLVLSSLDDTNHRPRQQDENNPKQLPHPVMRHSSALRPTPETERPVSASEAEYQKEETTPVTTTTVQQQKQHQREEKQQHCQPTSATPTVPGDSVNNRHHPGGFHDSTEMIGQEPVSPPSFSVSSSASSFDDNNGSPLVTSLPPGGSATTLTSISAKRFDEVDKERTKLFISPSLPFRIENETLIPDIVVAQQSSPPLLLHQQQAINDSQGLSFSVSATDHNYQEQKKDERVKYQKDSMISSTMMQSISHQKKQAIVTRDNNPNHQLYQPHGISDQVNHDKQYGWNNYSQEEITMSNGTLTMLIDKHHDFYHHHYQPDHNNSMTGKTTMEPTRYPYSHQSCGSGEMHSLLGDSQGIIGQQQGLQVAVL
ncbi:hypothetical protein INT45_012067 [Circinella minor]|uniref:Uncharacterized protein n=1 Tax=Circinella minor TaxID=1195481 RepID=A0A8H7SH68_9FUNG|nr:hypothetical protein INT45_012067 [Circinella minor]